MKRFLNRDISWLYFNERVLDEAGKSHVPLMERLRFLAIFSSNLDEFYRVRVPLVLALSELEDDALQFNEKYTDTAKQISTIVATQQAKFGAILQAILPALEAEKILLHYNSPIPEALRITTAHYFFSEILAFIQPVLIESNPDNKFFPKNNRLYLVVEIETATNIKEAYLINIPSSSINRFFSITTNGEQHHLFIDDIIKEQLPAIFRHATILNSYSIKITRDAELNLKDDYEGDLAVLMEEKIALRDFGLATRVLYDQNMPAELLSTLIQSLGLEGANMVAGGRYHHLKDLASLEFGKPRLVYQEWKPVNLYQPETDSGLMDTLLQKDILLHTPYHSYDTVLRFFNEAAIDPEVEAIWVTLYRVAANSRIVNALLSAAQNGKKVTVLVELKARFDEANNIKWAKRLKSKGVKVIYTPASLKVHAKTALVRKVSRHNSADQQLFGLLATGNLNEITARFYTDHILLTTNKTILEELLQLFELMALGGKTKILEQAEQVAFQNLLVAKFNLQSSFLELIDHEIRQAKQGQAAAIILKMNNLEEKSMVEKLYEAAAAGVSIQLIIRGICRLNTALFENIAVHRIVDRYLEHGRVFIFYNGGNEKIFLGSADWMQRNIFRRIEVCFPVEDPILKKEIKQLVALQLQDNFQGGSLNERGQNIPLPHRFLPLAGALKTGSQEAIYNFLKSKQDELIKQ